jgi:hypothetical protein
MKPRKRLIRAVSNLQVEAEQVIASFNSWAKELDRRNRSGEFGKWPWQKQYGLWPWQRKRKP